MTYERRLQNQRLLSPWMSNYELTSTGACLLH